MNLLTGTYSQDNLPYCLGQKYDIGTTVTESLQAEGAINFGDAVAKGTLSGHGVQLNNVSQKFRGVALKTHTIGTGKGYVQYDPVSVIRQGRVPVQVIEAVTDGDAAYACVASPGKFCKTATGNVATGGIFRADAAANSIAILDINLP